MAFNCRGGGIEQSVSNAAGPKTVTCPACGKVFQRIKAVNASNKRGAYVRVPRHSTTVSASEQISRLYGLGTDVQPINGSGIGPSAQAWGAKLDQNGRDTINALFKA